MCRGYYELPCVDCVFSYAVRSSIVLGLRSVYSSVDRCVLRLLLDWCNVVVVWFRSVKTGTVDIAIGLILRCLLSLYADNGPCRIGFLLLCTLEVVFPICL